jgi:hypothetical protein
LLPHHRWSEQADFVCRRQRERKRERSTPDGDADTTAQRQPSGGAALPVAPALGGLPLLPAAGGAAAGGANTAAASVPGNLGASMLSIAPRLGSAEPLQVRQRVLSLRNQRIWVLAGQCFWFDKRTGQTNTKLKQLCPQAASTALAAVSHALGAAQGFTRAPGGTGQAVAGSGKRRKQSDGDDTPARFELSDLSGIAGLVSNAAALVSMTAVHMPAKSRCVGPVRLA